MLTKAEQTSKYIIEKVAPIFNQKGYAATSMADITAATGLTKGALYGNFKNKEAIAIASFNKTINDLLKQVAKHQEQSGSPLGKLLLITDFYRNYFEYSNALGGCPILNIGVDSTHQNTKLLEQVQYVIQKTQSHIVKLVEWGIEIGEIKTDVDARAFSKYLYSRIQGAIFMSQTMQDKSYLTDASDEIDKLIHSELKN